MSDLGTRRFSRACFSAGWVDGETSTEKATIITPTEEPVTSLQRQPLPPSLPWWSPSAHVVLSTSRLSGYARSAWCIWFLGCVDTGRWPSPVENAAGHGEFPVRPFRGCAGTARVGPCGGAAARGRCGSPAGPGRARGSGSVPRPCLPAALRAFPPPPCLRPAAALGPGRKSQHQALTVIYSKPPPLLSSPFTRRCGWGGRLPTRGCC